MNKRIIYALITALAFTGCATSTSKRLDEKLAHQSEVSSSLALQSDVTSLIEDDSSLTSEQKSRLLTLQTEATQKRKDLERESLKLREILIEDMLSPDFNRDEADVIQNRLKDNEMKRLNVIFNAVKEANSILGHQRPVATRKIIGHILH